MIVGTELLAEFCFQESDAALSFLLSVTRKKRRKKERKRVRGEKGRGDGGKDEERVFGSLLTPFQDEGEGRREMMESERMRWVPCFVACELKVLSIAERSSLLLLIQARNESRMKSVKYTGIARHHLISHSLTFLS